MCTVEAVHWSPAGTTAAPAAGTLQYLPWHRTAVSTPPLECAGAVAYSRTSDPAASEMGGKRQCHCRSSVNGH